MSSLSHGHFGRAHARSLVLKVGMIGDAQIGKTSLMVKYVEGSFEYAGMSPGVRAEQG